MLGGNGGPRLFSWAKQQRQTSRRAGHSRPDRPAPSMVGVCSICAIHAKLRRTTGRCRTADNNFAIPANLKPPSLKPLPPRWQERFCRRSQPQRVLPCEQPGRGLPQRIGARSRTGKTRASNSGGQNQDTDANEPARCVKVSARVPVQTLVIEQERRAVQQRPGYVLRAAEPGLAGLGGKQIDCGLGRQVVGVERAEMGQ